VVVVAVVMSVAGISAAGGSVRSASSGTQGDVCTAKRVGGTVTFGQFSMPPSADPGSRNFGGAGGTDIYSALYDTLLRLNTKTSEVTPYLAQSFTHNPGYTQFTLKLRPGIKFGNGDAFDAAAVVGAQTRYLAGSAFSGFAPYISSIVAVDPLTVQYNLAVPWAELANQLSQTFGMIADPAVANRLGAAFGSTVNTGAGVGPYDLVTFNPPTSIVLKAKTNYWQGPVCIQEIDNTTIASSQQGIDSFNTGQYQLTYMRDPTLFKQYTATKPRVGQYVSTLNVGAVDIQINTQAKAAHLDDVRVRQAIEYANDVNTINQRAYGGNLVAHTNLVPKELGVLKPTQGPKYDPAKATKLLNQVESETGWDGSIRLLCAQTSADMGVALAAVLNNVGFKVNLDTTLATTAFTTRTNVLHDYDIACGGLQVLDADYWDALYVRTFATVNQSQLNNPDWNAAMAELAATPIGTPAYQAAINKAQALQIELAPLLVVGSFPEATLMQNTVHGVDFTTHQIALWGKAYLATK
jgi:peptide/nickel transport system substrate-binding protein